MPTESKPSMDISILSTHTIFPEFKPDDEPKSVPLSIIDNTVSNFSRCAAIWFFPPSLLVTPTHLQVSLSKTLNSYPQWCGRLSWSSLNPGSTLHTERYRRIWITYGSSSDIGVPFLTATSPKRLDDFLPENEVRKRDIKVWDGSQLPSSQLLPSRKMGIVKDDPNAPNMIIQCTSFGCGSMALSVQITHCLADANTLSRFANDWGSVSRAMLSGSEIPMLEPLFEPGLLDRCAKGDIDKEEGDEEVRERARELPMHRYDWYKEVDGQPWPTRLPEDWDTVLSSNEGKLSLSQPIPWKQWGTKLPVSHRVLHFSAEEIERIFEPVISSPSGDRGGERISKHDALLGYVWGKINKARELEVGTEVYLNMSLGLRGRVERRLPDRFVGSPITIAAISTTITKHPDEEGRQKEGNEAGKLARRIRQVLGMFTPEKIAELLYDESYEVAPQRLWRGCLGREHVLLTTWVRSGVYDVNFGGGWPRYVEAVMPYMDGLVEVMEAPPPRRGDGEGQGETGGEGGMRGKWYEDGVDVSVYLEEGAMGRLVGEELREGVVFDLSGSYRS